MSAGVVLICPPPPHPNATETSHRQARKELQYLLFIFFDFLMSRFFAFGRWWLFTRKLFLCRCLARLLDKKGVARLWLFRLFRFGLVAAAHSEWYALRWRWKIEPEGWTLGGPQTISLRSPTATLGPTGWISHAKILRIHCEIKILSSCRGPVLVSHSPQQTISISFPAGPLCSFL